MQQRQPDKIYCDARFVGGNRWAIGYCSLNMGVNGYKIIKASDNNVAELEAIRFAKQSNPGSIILSDSLNSVTALNDPSVAYIERSLNFADSYLRNVRVK
nr:MAG TPA: RNaseH-like protein [Bacteriophage sp.]